MKCKLLSLGFILLCGIYTNAQILNGGFEEWSSGEPSYWLSNNVNEPNITLTPITQSTIAYSGSYSVKGEVVTYEINGQTATYAPILQSGNQSALGFPYSGKPDRISGYYNFVAVGGDGFVNNVFLMNGEDLLAVGGITRYTSTGPGWHELVMDLFYMDSLTTPNKILFNFQIIPAQGAMETHEGSVFYLDNFPAMSLIKPPGEMMQSHSGQIVFIAGETDTIKWSSGGAENIDIEYSLDEGASYKPIELYYPGDSSRYFWHVPPDLFKRKAKVRITNSYSMDEITSTNFTIKPWQLTRIDAGDELEPFEPNQDGWSYPNTTDTMWPMSWWQQFDYQYPGTDPNTGSFYPFMAPFKFALPRAFPDWPLFTDVFGIQQCYKDTTPPASYSSKATGRWRGVASGHNGSCFGFSVSSLLGFYFPGNLIIRFPGIGNFGALYNVPLSDASRKAVNHFFVHQFGQEDTRFTNAHFNDSPRQLLQNLKDMFRRENGDGRALSFYNQNGSGAHTVVPYKLDRVGTTHTFYLRVYDSNAPGSSNQIIFIDSSNNIWKDNTGLSYGQGSSQCFLEPENGDFLFRPTLKSNKDMSLSVKGINYMYLYNTSQAEIMISSPSGNQIGYQDSSVVLTLPNSIPIIPKSGHIHPPVGYYIPEDDYLLELNNFTDSASYVIFISDSTIYNYRRFDANNTQTDLLSYSQTGVGVLNPDQSVKSFELETVILQDTTLEKVFVLDNVSTSPGDSIHIREKERNELEFENYGVSISYNLQIRISSAEGGGLFSHMSIPMEQNSGHRIVPDWNDLQNAPVKILIDLGNDGTIDDSLFVMNQTTNIENQIYAGIPNHFRLLQNYPNPFNPTTTITYDLPSQSDVNLSVYNILGEKVATLVNEVKQAGRHKVIFNGAGLSSGIYLYKIQAGSYVTTRKMLLIK